MQSPPRKPKTQKEITQILEACEIAGKVLLAAVEKLKIGKSEKYISKEITKLARKFGAEKLAFKSIVAFGESSAIPHHRPTGRKLKRGDAVKIDMGVMKHGMCSDITRTFFVGEATAKQRKVYNRVLRSQTLALKTVEARVKARFVDKVAREAMQEWKGKFIHGTGHGVGKLIHEDPRLKPKSLQTLKAGDVITVEPGLYFAGEFGVRIEDTIVVTKAGFEFLTKLPRKLTILRI
ncbi:MAG: M24 family metallopeptidase [Candidatus Gracilibacteria bacterium]|nr:M24 family metallopeptidase [Candidatus Gracilibacteria bacterium]MDD5179101.1 M24 family metallopeptidase [Candidatus Gracilibacteria bacterium]